MYEIVIDLETTVKGPNKSPEAQYDDNYVVLYGWKECGDDIKTSRSGADLFDAIETAYTRGRIPKIIGHNLKFDLKYLMKERPDLLWEKFEYHCTMYTEYRQSGHLLRFSSLEASCAKHGIPFAKGLDLAALIAADVEIEDIPLSDLEPYLIDDVDSTFRLHHQQINHPDYIEYDQLHVAALADMELLGLPLDVHKAEETLEDMYIELDSAEAELWALTVDKLGWDDGSSLLSTHLKFTSARTVSYLLTGEPAAGLTKRVRKNIAYHPGRECLLSPTEIKKVWGDTEPTHLGYPMSKKEIAELEKIGSCKKYMTALLEYRKFNKLIGTYIGPFLEQAKVQPTIHPKMNMCTTGTGRLSSSAPNGQNMPEIIRNMFRSDNCWFHEIDFKQLEVVALAHLSRDQVLLNDIQSGQDIHYNTGKHVMGWRTKADMTDKERKLVKNSIQTGQPQALIKKLIDAFYARYTRVKEWQEEFYTMVTGNMQPAGFKDGEALFDSLVVDPTSKRKFYFKESVSPNWLARRSGRSFSFKPTETKNYPVQGYAGGDIVMTALALLWQVVRPMKDTDIRMTVHDSILVDTDLSDSVLAAMMKVVCIDVEQRYGLPFNLDFDVTSGHYWQ